MFNKVLNATESHNGNSFLVNLNIGCSKLQKKLQGSCFHQKLLTDVTFSHA